MLNQVKCLLLQIKEVGLLLFRLTQPWKLTTDRLQLDFSNDGAANVKPRKWNTALSGVIEFIYVRIIRAVFEHPDHFGLSLSELHRILHGHQVFRLNRPGSDWSDYSAGDVHRNKMKLELGDMYSGTLNPSDLAWFNSGNMSLNMENWRTNFGYQTPLMKISR